MLSKKELSDYVKKAIGLYSELIHLEEQKYLKQMAIAEICISVCPDKGHRTYTNYNISNFAKDSGIPLSSIREWVDVYRRVIPIIGADKIQNNADWDKMKKVANKHRIRTNPTCKEIERSFYIEEKPVITLLKESKTDISRLILGLSKYDLNIIKDRTLLISLMQDLDIASDMINNYLTDKQRAVGMINARR